MNDGPILIVDGDEDDRELLKEAFSDLGYKNPLLFLSNGNAVLAYLDSNKKTPFLILCDVNIPGMDGFQLKAKLLEQSTTNYKSVPFVFWSSRVSRAQVQHAYDLAVNGFFVKEDTFEEIKVSLSRIVDYWARSKVPE